MQELKEWYGEVQDIAPQPNGQITINPVAVNDSGEIETVTADDNCHDTPEVETTVISTDKVSEKDSLDISNKKRVASLLFMNDKVKFALLELDKIENPQTDGSIQFQIINDEIKYLLNQMIEKLEG